MALVRMFFDSSVLFAASTSTLGAAHALLLRADGEALQIVVSRQVVEETERALTEKKPEALVFLRALLARAGISLVPDPEESAVQAAQDIIGHADDVAIVLAVMHAGVDYLVTHNRRHFIDDPEVAAKSGLRIGTPGDALAWLRQQLLDEEARHG